MQLRSLGQYRLVRELTPPGAAHPVHLVRHEDEPEHERATYVAKLLRPQRTASTNELARQRAVFDHEVRLLESINHPCSTTLHASGDQDGVRYLVMDRVDGVQLSVLLGHNSDAPRALRKEVAVFIAGQLADVLRHMHTLEYLDNDEPTPLDVVHRSVSPENIMLSRTGDVVLVGFGSATSAWLDPAHQDPHAGALAYMAPERMLPDGRASAHTDLFALAVTLWEMLRGERCLAAGSDSETRAEIARFDISQASRRVLGVSPKLSEVVRKNLDRDPRRRYKSAFQMLQRLAQSPEAALAEASRAALAQAVCACAPAV